MTFPGGIEIQYCPKMGYISAQILFSRRSTNSNPAIQMVKVEPPD